MIGSGSLTVRLSTAIVAILMSAALIAAALNFLKFSRTIEEQETRLYSFVVTDIADTLERALALGVPLSILSNAQQVIDRRKVQDPTIVRISVTASGGRRILFDTDRTEIGRRIPAEWSAPTAETPTWRATAADRFLVGARIVNTFGQTVGWVVLGYDRGVVVRKTTSILHSMLQASLVAIGLGSVIAIGAVWALCIRMRRLWADIGGMLESAQAHDGAVPREAEPDRLGGLAFANATQTALARLTAAEREVENALVET
jgi:NADH:ubiquinone oxidoreductase subunit K